MVRFAIKPLSVALAVSMSLAGPASAQSQQAPAGASKASSAAVGGVSAGTIGAAVAVVAAAAALSGGSGGASAASVSGSSTSAATQASTAASQSRTANTAAAAASSTFGGATDEINAAASLATELQVVAENAASDLAISNTVAISGVVNPITGKTVCAAANTCTAAERLKLAYDAARFAKAASEATLAYIALVEANGLARFQGGHITAATYATGTAALAQALNAALLAQTAANEAIAAYNALATAVGVTGTTITSSTGTTGTLGGTGSISGFNLTSGGQ